MIARGERVRALLETLRAPLLLTPVADVAAGFALARAAAGASPVPDALPLALAAAAGCCLLAAGMAQNALVDLPLDRVRHPGRPLARGVLAPGTVRHAQRALWLAGLILAGLLSLQALVVALAIVLVTQAYHLGLKRRRWPGCLALGTARGLDMLLGMVAGGLVALPAEAPRGRALGLVALYGVYVLGASLHASTDDEPRPAAGRPAASVAGLGLALGALLVVCLDGLPTPQAPLAVAGRLVLAWAALRLAWAATRLPAPQLTGVALSGLPLFCAGLCWLAGGAIPGALALLVFAAGRLALRSFAPT